MEIVISALIILGIIMILGFIGNYIFDKTQIPSIVWLLLFGLIVGFVFNIKGGISEINDVLPTLVSEFFAGVAIIIILFDGGINTDLYQLFKGAPRGLLLTISSFFLSIIGTILVIISLSSAGLLDISFENSLIVGTILGGIIAGTSSPIVMPIACKLKNLQEKSKMILSIESIITDPLSIVFVLAGIYMISSNSSNIWLGLRSLVVTFSVGIVIGIAIGLIWLPIMHKVRKEKFSYVLTLAVVFLVYSITTFIVGSENGGTGAGAIACLMFGLILGNGKKILKIVNYEGKKFELDEQSRDYHSLVSFLIRTFFFVYLGIMVSFQNITFILVGIIVLLALIAFRYISIYISAIKGGFEKDDKQTMITMMPRGLAAAILAINFGPFLVGEKGLNLGNNMVGFFQDIAFVVILGTAIICTVGVSVISHYENKKNNIKNSES